MNTTACGLQHIGIPTDKIDDTIHFYEGLGFCTVLCTEGKSGQKVAFLKLGDFVIETYENCQTAQKAGAIDHFALDVEDIEKAYSIIKSGAYEIIENGIQFLPFWENGVRYFTIRGPNNEKIEFIQML